jgi:hypothetical protein
VFGGTGDAGVEWYGDWYTDVVEIVDGLTADCIQGLSSWKVTCPFVICELMVLPFGRFTVRAGVDGPASVRCRFGVGPSLTFSSLTATLLCGGKTGGLALAALLPF